MKKKIREFTLEIDDNELAEEYKKRRFPQINEISSVIAYAKTIYGFFVMWQYVQGKIGGKRPLVYQTSNIIHYLSIHFFKMYPQYQKYHSSFTVFMFCSFVSNEASVYGDKTTESMALMVGYNSAVYLASAFLTYQWYYFTVGNVISTMIVIYYYCVNFNLSLNKLAPSLIISCIASSIVSYYVELWDKKEFLEMKKTEQLQNDLKKVLQVLPEGVMIYQRFDNPHIKLWNNEFVKLFKFKTLPPNQFSTTQDENQNLTTAANNEEMDS